jgi:hypothetical protein
MKDTVDYSKEEYIPNQIEFIQNIERWNKCKCPRCEKAVEEMIKEYEKLYGKYR